MSLLTLSIALLSLFFLFASSIKITGWQKKIYAIQLGMFEKYGLNQLVMSMVGYFELLGAVTIWAKDSALGSFGALLLLGTSLGAIGCHLIWDSWKDAIPAIITSILSAYVLFSGINSLFDALGLG